PIFDSLSLRQLWRSQMGNPHPLALRERVVAFVEEGNTHRSCGEKRLYLVPAATPDIPGVAPGLRIQRRRA
ncbi:MAG: hypothetical protein ACE5FS_11560, partial [Paracoccaceae bacterium]